MRFKRTALMLLSSVFFGTALGGIAPSPVHAQTSDIKTSQDVAPELIQAREQAENDLKQVHLLARYQKPAPSQSAPQETATIDSQYDDLAASVNGYLKGFAAAVQLPGPLDDAKWKDKGTAVLAQATTFDDSMKKIRAENSSASGTRAFFLLGIVNILEQVLIPGATGYQKIKSDAEAASTVQRKQISDVVLTAVWRDSATVLGGQAKIEPAASPVKAEPSASPLPK